MDHNETRTLLRASRNRLTEALHLLNDSRLGEDELIKYLIGCALSEMDDRLSKIGCHQAA